MKAEEKKQILWWALIGALVVLISVLHYTTPTTKWQYHLIFMQGYFIPIILGAFQFGIRGGLGTAVAVSMIYFPHIMLQWGGLVETNLMRFLQILLFNVIGYLTGLKAQKEQDKAKKLQQVADQLERSLLELKQKSEQLAEMEDQLHLADRLSIIGEMAATLAHEVRNPLGSIRGVVDILRDELPNNPKTDEFLNILITETNRLNEVVENYLGFARRPKNMFTEIQVGELIRSVVFFLSGRAQRSGVRLHTQLLPEPLFVQGDPNQLRQILVNLILNAIQSLPAGGKVQIETHIEHREYQETSGVKPDANTDRHLQIIVSDNGEGIEEQHLAKIFQPFFSTKPEGTGLGLAIVKRLVEQSQWHISCESQKGKGTRFILTIPLYRVVSGV
ncbi:MAG: ATP-binding protein [Calditrichia bacterium]